jgi:hypothetical protein
MIAFSPCGVLTGLSRTARSSVARLARLAAASIVSPAAGPGAVVSIILVALFSAWQPAPQAWAGASGAPLPIAGSLYADPLPVGQALLVSLAPGDSTRPARSKRPKPAPAEKVSARRSSPKPVKKADKPPVSVKAVVEFQSIYDDNIFRFSDENLLAYRRGESPWKFGMRTYDDLIMSPRFTVDFGRKILGSKETTFRVKYTLWQYSYNPGKSNSSWFVRLRQPVRSKDALELSYTYAPPAYIRQLSDRAPFVSRAVPLVWLRFEGTRNAFGLAYSARLTNRLSFRFDGGRVLRYYNKPFMENDQWEWNAAGTATVKVASSWSVAGKYQYANAKSRAMDTVGETPLTSDDGDGSAKRDLYQASIAYAPSGLWKVSEVALTAQTMSYYYTTKRPYFEDPTHTGRKDDVSAAELTLATRPVYGPVTLELGYRFSTRSSSSAASDVGADAIEEDKNYSNNRFWLGMSWPL